MDELTQGRSAGGRPRILLIGAGDFQLPIVKRAAERFDVCLAAPVISEKFLPYCYDTLLTDVRDKEKILAYAQEMGVIGVTTDETDIPVRTIAYIAEKMGLPGIGYETGCLFTDKSLMREKMAQLGIPLLPNRTVHSLEEALAFYEEIGGTVVIKPLDTQGSRGVQTCRNAEELREKYAEAARWSSHKDVIVERCATGREFVVEGRAYRGRFTNLCIGDTLYFDLPDAFAAKSRIFPTTADDALRDRVLDLNTRIIEGFGLWQGITHSEFIMEGDEIYLIETAARGGGVFISSDLIRLSCGVIPEDFLLDVATGKEPDLTVLPQQCVCGYMAFFVPEGKILRVEGVQEVLDLSWIHHTQLDHLHAGTENHEGHTDKTSRIALTLSAPDRETFNKRMEIVRQTLRVDVETPEGIQGLIWE